MPELLRDGYTDLPPGKIASIVTYLEMRAPPPTDNPAPLNDIELRFVPDPELHWYRALHRRIGADLLWFGRLGMETGELSAILRDPRVEIHVPMRAGAEIGIVELDARTPGEVELAYFGLIPECVGTGIGRWLMDRAIELAWRHAPKRFFLHTCTLDHPAALDFYLRSGFTPCRRAIEIADDPRLVGILPRDAAPHVPII